LANAIGTLPLQPGGSEKEKPRRKDGAAVKAALQAVLFDLAEAAMKSEASAIPPVAHRVFVMAESVPLEATTSPVHRRYRACLSSGHPRLSFDGGSRGAAQRKRRQPERKAKAKCR
jgi:cell envelope opacity-associated protein A